MVTICLAAFLLHADTMPAYRLEAIANLPDFGERFIGNSTAAFIAVKLSRSNQVAKFDSHGRLVGNFGISGDRPLGKDSYGLIVESGPVTEITKRESPRSHIIRYLVPTVDKQGNGFTSAVEYPSAYAALLGWQGNGALFISNDERPVMFRVNTDGSRFSRHLYMDTGEHPARVLHSGAALPNGKFVTLMSTGNMTQRSLRGTYMFGQKERNRYHLVLIDGESGRTTVLGTICEEPSSSFVVEEANKIAVIEGGSVIVLRHGKSLYFLRDPKRRIMNVPPPA